MNGQITRYRLYRIPGEKLWAICEKSPGLVSTRWADDNEAHRLPFEKTRIGDLKELVREKELKGYTYVDVVPYDQKGRVHDPDAPPDPPLDGIAWEWRTPWNFTDEVADSFREEVDLWTSELCRESEFFEETDDGLQVGRWCFCIGEDWDPLRRSGSLLLPADDPLPPIFLIGLRTRLGGELAQGGDLGKGMTLSYPDGTELPYDPHELLNCERFRSHFGVDQAGVRKLLEGVGLLTPQVHWEQVATGSDWF